MTGRTGLCSASLIIRRTACLLALLMAALTSAVQGQDAPFAGVVSEERVAVLSGGGSAFYKVGELTRGAGVQVEEIVTGWHKIVPPPGVQSVISKDAVQLQPDGRTATVIAENPTPVFAASVESTGGANRHYRRQLSLARGQTVQVQGEDGSFYLIAPPTGAYVWVAPGAIRRAQTAAPAAPAAPEPAMPSPAAPAPVTPMPPIETPAPPAAAATPAPAPVEPPVAVAPPAPVAPPVPAPPPSPRRAAALYAQAEAAFAEASDLPVEQQPMDHLLSTYLALQAEPSLLPSEARMVAARLAYLRRNAQIAQQLREIAGLRDEMAAGQQALAEEQARRAAAVRALPALARRYDAVGQLVGSSIYDGEKMPRLFRLANPATQRTVAYVAPSAHVNPHLHLGQVVGIMGQSRYDAALKLPIFEVKRIDILEALPGE